ncbi:SDR family oxidoreductase [Nocardioides marinquilinus]|uniref:SDR family oxidoreductase n=1 Tax=Nocardioides marinquilinus TaxID=1210400 RepID=A0ABP9Q248_9ACTN
MTSDRVTVLTGGSRGIGAATARLWATSATPSDVLLLTYRSRAEDAARVVADVVDAGGRAEAVRCDVADPAEVAGVFERADALGVLVALVNNAATLEQQADFEDLDHERWRRVFATNVLGVAEACRHAVRRMSAAHGGRGGAVVNVSSKAAQLGSPHEYVDYAASKAALETLTRGLALEVAPHGVRVNGVRPGIIDTDMHADGGEPGRAARLGPGQPMGRAGTAEEVAAAILWLLSPAASFTTGAFVDVSGGR